MSSLYLAAATGLLGLLSGLIIVNVFPSPRTAQLRTTIASIGMLILAIVTLGWLFDLLS